MLVELGHDRIGAVHGPLDTSTGRERAELLGKALRKRGPGLRRSNVRRSAFSHDAGFAAARDLFGTAERPTAIVCANDVVAVGVLSAARTLGLSVPRDLTVIGFDDIPMARWPMIDLTTVRCDLNALAHTAVSMLVDEIADPGRPVRLVRTPVHLVERGTHASPAYLI